MPSVHTHGVGSPSLLFFHSLNASQLLAEAYGVIKAVDVAAMEVTLSVSSQVGTFCLHGTEEAVRSIRMC